MGDDSKTRGNLSFRSKLKKAGYSETVIDEICEWYDVEQQGTAE